MIDVYKGNILDCGMPFVNPINCFAVSGAGLAKQVVVRWPHINQELKAIYKNHGIEFGKVYCVPTYSREQFVLCVATKRHWRDKSNIDDVVRGIDALRWFVGENNIDRVCIPPLGCGLGGLQWSQVKPEIVHYFQDWTGTAYIIEP